MLDIRKPIPDFSLPDEDGRLVTKASLKGKRFVLYFYPKDSTPGCTTQACGFRDEQPAFGKLGVPVFGISADTVASHRRFADKQSLNFRLLADPERQLIEGLGAWGEKTLYGRKYMGILRCTFVVDASGRVEQVWPKVDVKTHAADVRRYLMGESTASAASVVPAKKAVAKAPAKAAPKAAAKRASKAPVKKAAVKKAQVARSTSRKA
ncbi:MAG: thioredoxin-dependent thiol peroxidase [Ahniella sp.]|nr:thioredoxin-dependent thiol peroxidase [Ahniella sp.]